MLDVIGSLVTVVAVLIALAALLGGLYALVNRLPDRFRESASAWVFILPGVAAATIGLVVPLLRTIFLSFFDDKGKDFVGLDNYGDIWATERYRLSVANSLAWVFIGTAATLVVGLVVARFADGMSPGREKAAKSAIFLPGAISLVGAGLIWNFVYAAGTYKVGLLNNVADKIPGLPDSMGGNGDRLWLLERGIGGVEPPDTFPGFNTVLLIVIFIWVSSGIATVIFSAAIKGVPTELIEAALVDGATPSQAFYKVTLPYIRSTIVTVATLTTIAGLKAFDIVSVATGGNFGTSTIANEFYVTRFVQGRNGMGSALAVLIFALVIPVVILNRQSDKRAAEMMGL